MNVLFRTVWVMIRATFRPKMGALDTSIVRLRVWPNDLDINFHLNNGRYLTMMDLGRYDLVVRNGLFRRVLEERWQPTVAAETIRFRRSLSPFQAFELRTRILGWDEKYFWIEQLFVSRGPSGDTVCAVGLVRALFRSREGNVPTREVLATIDYRGPVPELPESVRLWNQADHLVHQQF